MERTILHCDLNNFYASVACHDNPALRNRPVAVCGDKEERHGIVLAKNMAAKLLGVSTGEAIWEAKLKCPELVTVKPDFARYSHFSAEARKIYENYSDLVEPFGPDEAWVDVSGSRLAFGTGEEIAEKIRRDIKVKLGLTVSIGVSFNKVFAKLGSDLKKPDAVTVISRENFKDKIWNLPVESIIGIGNSTRRGMNSMGIITLKDLALSDDDALKRRFGIRGPQLKQYALGNDISKVAPQGFHRVPKSIGRSTTYRKDITDINDVWRIMLKLADEVGAELRKEQVAAYGVQIHLRSYDLHITELQMPLALPTQNGLELAQTGRTLFEDGYVFDKPLRSIGIRAINLQPFSGSAKQITLFCDLQKEIKLDKIDRQLDLLHTKFGKNCVFRGTLLGEYFAPTASRPFSVMYRLTRVEPVTPDK